MRLSLNPADKFFANDSAFPQTNIFAIVITNVGPGGGGLSRFDSVWVGLGGRSRRCCGI